MTAAALPVNPVERRHQQVLALWTRWRLQQLSQGAAVSERAFASHLGLSPSQWSQHKAGKPLGDRLARQIEAACGVPSGWLDRAPEAPPVQPSELEPLGPGAAGALWQVLGPGTQRVMAQVQFSTPAGFPSPAADFDTDRVDLVQHLGLDQPTTFLARVRGLSMIGKGIDDGDLIVVNRALSPRHGHTVVAVIDNELTVKTLYQRQGVTKLVAANPDFPDIVPKEGQALQIWGVVTSAIKKLAY